jgi:hypothetical protein
MDSAEVNSLIDTLNSIDFPLLLGIFGFIFVVIIRGIIKNHNILFTNFLILHFFIFILLYRL